MPSEHDSRGLSATTHMALAGGGEMGARIRAFDWSATPLGPVSSWPRSLLTCVRLILTSRQPMFVWWGEQLLNLYNDAYRSIVGGKHPQALGQPASVVWREIWEQVGPRTAVSLRGNEGTYDEALLLIMNRNGYDEETYYTFSYSPVPDDEGGVGGIFCANTDDTARIVGERQIALLRELASRTVDARTAEDACALAASSFATNQRDLLFALVYLTDSERQGLRLAGSMGIAPGHTAAPASVSLADGAPWPFARVLQGDQPVLVSDLDERFGELPTGAWERPPQSAVMLPIMSAGSGGVVGVLVVGLNPFRRWDDGYQGFLSLVVGQMEAAISNAQAYAEERRRAEALAELDRAKTAFFSNISHEFRTPLTLLLGPTEDALASPGRSLHGAALDTVHRNALRLLKLVNTLLDFSRVEAGRAQVAYEPVDLATFTTELASAFRSAFDRAELRLDVRCEPLGEPIFVDRDMWEKIVLNLLSNAFKHTFHGGVEVSLALREHAVELAVSDTGVGIPQGELPHLFERFHRVRGARSRTHEGTGIGLALVHELVGLHQGQIQVRSEVGLGTTFSVMIPRGKAHLSPAHLGPPRALSSTSLGAAPFVEEATRWVHSEPTAPPSERLGEVPRSLPGWGGPRARVLVADDNADMRGYLERLLRPHCDVTTVADGAAALAAAQASAPDLILSDVMMPGLDGFQLLQAIRLDEGLRTTPFILLSARAGDEAVVEGIDAGADDYLVKPFSARELQARVRGAMALSALRRENLQLLERERAARRQAETESRLRDEFLATVSHELRTPLQAILGWSRMLVQLPPEPARLAKGLEIIERNSRAQAQIIDDILEVSAIVRGKVRLSPRPVEVRKLVDTAIETLRVASDARRITVVGAVDDDVGQIVVDADRLAQVIWNLLSNSLKYGRSGGHVELRARRAAGLVEITIQDDGQGIRPEFLPHVFERFRQGDQATTRSYSGLGLGLSIVRHLIELHGGTVQAFSEGEGKGATFTIRLPVSLDPTDERPAPRASAPTIEVTPSSQPAALADARLLVVDDEADIRDILVAVLTAAGAHVEAASSVREALGLLRTAPFDALISDIGMPSEDGYELVRQLRSLPSPASALPALALTAYARPEDRRLALEAGFQAHLAKPVDPARLLAAVSELVVARPG